MIHYYGQKKKVDSNSYKKSDFILSVNSLDKNNPLTAHRRENIGSGLINICNSVIQLLNIYDDIIFLISVHPNPLISSKIKENLAIMTVYFSQILYLILNLFIL